MYAPIIKPKLDIHKAQIALTNKFKPNRVIREELEIQHKEDSLNIDESDVDNDSDSSGDNFKKQAKLYIRKHVKTIIDKDKEERKSRQNKGKSVSTNPRNQNLHNLLKADSSKFDTENSIKTEDLFSDNSKLSKDGVFQILYSKNYERERGPHKFGSNKKNGRMFTQILHEIKANKDSLPSVNIKRSVNNELPTIHEGRYMKPQHPLIKSTDASIAEPAPLKRMSSYELMNMISPTLAKSRSNGILAAIQSSVQSPTDNSGRRSSSKRFADELMASNSLNDKGLLGTLISEIRQDRVQKIKKLLTQR